MWEDHDASRNTDWVPEQRILRCPRLNRRLQSAYRQFRVAPRSSDLDEIGMPAVPADDGEQRDPGMELPPAGEVEVEATTVFHEAEPAGDDVERPRPEQPEPAPPMNEARVGLRAIFATESDSTGEMPYASAPAESDGENEDHSNAVPRDSGATDDRSSKGPSVQPQATNLSAQPQVTNLVWKSFPKPLQRK